MCEPPLIHYATEKEYREHFERVYCSGCITTFDGYKVRIFPNQFKHCMYESSKRSARSKDIFSHQRAERIDWISATLSNPKADLYQGWNSDLKLIDPNSRVANAYNDYVVIMLFSKTRGGIWVADFKTAFVADSSIGLIREMPRWDIKNCR